MKMFLKHIYSIKAYLIISGLFILIGGIILSMNEKVAIHLAINSCHNDFFDFFFTYCTYLGDGLVTAIAILPLGLLVFKKRGWSVFVLGWGTLILVGIFAQFGKHFIYPNAARPLKFIGENLLYLVPNVDVHEMNSFPSGHSTTAFAFFGFVAFTFFRQNITGQIGCVILAILVGYSRIYLSQHFLEDVIAGASLGLLALLFMQMITSAFFKSEK